jgi:hypothetical protein
MSVDGNGRVGIEALGGDIGEDSMYRAPQQRAIGNAVGFARRNRPLCERAYGLSEFLGELGCQAAGFLRTHERLSNRRRD